MLQELTVIEENFQIYLRPDDYTFIGPENQEQLADFIKVVSRLAPGQFFGNSVHVSLSNKEAVRKALSLFPNTSMCVYAVVRANNQMLLPNTLEHYCKIYNIDWQM